MNRGQGIGESLERGNNDHPSLKSMRRLYEFFFRIGHPADPYNRVIAGRFSDPARHGA
jgi:hypothetical protein